MYFQDQCVQEDFVALLEEINEIRPLEIRHGGVWSNEREPLGSQVGSSRVINVVKRTL